MARLSSLLLLLLLLLLTSTAAQGEYGVVHVVSENWSKDYCVLFSSDYVTLPRDLRHAPLLPLHDGTTAPWCPGEDPTQQAQHTGPSQKPLRQSTAMVMRGNCSFYAKGWLAQGRGAHGLIIVSRVSGQQCSDTVLVSQDPRQPLLDLSIPVAVLRYADMLDIFSHTRGGGIVRVALYAPPEPVLDYNMVVIFILAVGTVAVGGYWAGLTEADRLQRHRAQGAGGGGGGGGGGPRSQSQVGVTTTRRGLDNYDEDMPMDFTPAMTGAVISMSCSIMLLLYFFYDRFVYVMIAIFGLGAGTGLYSCLAPLLCHLQPRSGHWVLPSHHVPLSLPLLLLASLCAAVATLWVTFRNEDRWAWLLQDTLGVAYCLFVLRRVRLPTLKNCASFLMALLAFDVFFVFVTPLFTRTGESIMVEVASGPVDSLSHERLPMVLRVPRLSFSALTLCDQPFSILGFGDIVVPGFLVAYCHRFDVQTHSRQVYFVACTLAYAVGLLLTFLAMALMKMGQPALLYLVSSTLLTSLAVAACRQEFTLFWSGQSKAKSPTTQLVSRDCQGSPGGPEQKQQDSAGIPTIQECESPATHLEGGLARNLDEGIAGIVTLPEDEASSPNGFSDNSEGWSHANLDPEELPQVPPRVSEELMPTVTVPPLMLPPLEYSHIHSQALTHTYRIRLPCLGLHKRRT
ncbi:signal peptide peptidase-like 2C [Erinaceus europaeus]|uniref:Signal peptide peptidase-like 2C n=1 Tax=Erinaceus europaeus TaxID=9365 RepID=A0A1S3A5L2_ERIEU|nr:signal peptide peptidase-like 2C [Erinaceus europaeus]